MLVVAPQRHVVAGHMQCAGCQHLLLCVLSRAPSTRSYTQLMHLRAGDLPDTVECIHHKVRRRRKLCSTRVLLQASITAPAPASIQRLQLLQ